MAPLLYCVPMEAVTKYQQSLKQDPHPSSTTTWTFQDIGNAPSSVLLAVIVLPLFIIAVPTMVLTFVSRKRRYLRLFLTTLSYLVTVAASSLLQWVTISMWESQKQESLSARPVGFLVLDFVATGFPILVGSFAWVMSWAVSGGFRGCNSWLANLEE
ncbi:Hypothetical predicted protein [Lecanosticta acicola]|uniref:Uncharacterized protein n=1 Tax=Lecanosticta acicola TaxID=111012 RepID=A0AAI8YW02_9PEZI|nr:Hypothetical predicted protein [Lecanosticta acicola]